MPLSSEQDLAKKYHDRFPEQTFSIGRNGSYRYSVDIDDSIEQALYVAELIKKLLGKCNSIRKHRSKNYSSMGKSNENSN